MYVETDFLLALAKSDDWLQDAAREALEERDDIHTSISSYSEFLLYAYEEGEGYAIDVPQAVTALVEQVPVRPEEHEQAVLTAAVLADEHGLTPFDAIHAGTAIGTDEPVLSSERAYADLALEHVALGPDDGETE